MNYRFIMSSVLVAGMMSACSSDDEMQEFIQTPVKTIVTSKQDTIKTVQADSIVPIEGCRDSLPPKVKPVTRSSYDDYTLLREELYQLNEIPIYLKVKGNSTDKHFLSTQGKGKELTVESFNANSDKQKFYIKILPMSSGIPYLIYSKQTETPIRIGAYSNAPDTKILYASQNASGSLFGASWDIKRGQYSDKSYVIENEDYVQQGNSGNWLDIYYSVITVNGTKISFSKYNRSPRQEFEIIPVEEFTVKDIYFDVEASSILSKSPTLLFSDSYTNNGPITQTHKFVISDSYKESSSFNKETSYNVSIATEVKVGVPFIANGKITTTVSGGQKFSYGSSEEVVKTITREYTVEVPKNYRAEMKLTLYKYDMDVSYIATCVGKTSGREIQIRGHWEGVNYEESDAVLNLTPINGYQAEPKKILIPRRLLKENEIIRIP